MRLNWMAALAVLTLAAAPGAAQTQPASASAPTSLPAGAGQYSFAGWDGPAVRVFYAIPEHVTATTPVLFVMHGVKRDADRYRDEWRQLAIDRGMILVVPEFNAKDFPRTAGYNGGNFLDADGKPRPRSQWSFALIEPLFDDIRARTGTQVPHYAIYGHSAGGQFVHRFVTFMPNARLSQAIAANAGWYTMPDLVQRYPYGLAGAPANAAMLKATLGKPMTILLGTADTDPNHENLRRTKEAMAQGPYRLARGRSYFAAGKAAAEKLGVRFGWRLQEVPGVAHQNGKMAVAAAALLDR